MPKGSKKRKAEKKRKELAAKTKANDEEAEQPEPEPPPAPDSQENSLVKAAAAVLAEPTVNLSERVTLTQAMLAPNVLEVDSEENEVSKELVKEVTSNVRPLDVVESNENSSGADYAGASNMAELADNLVNGVVQNENVLAQDVLEFGSKENEASKELPLNEIASNLTFSSNAEGEVLKENEGDQFDAVTAEETLAEEITQVLLNKGVVQSTNLLAQDALKKTGSFPSAEQNLKQSEGNLLKKIVPRIDIETSTEMIETSKESTGIVLRLNRIKELVETGLSLADHMKELFLVIMEDLNVVLDA